NPEFDLLQKNFSTNLDQISFLQNKNNKNPDILEDGISHDDNLHHKVPNDNQTTKTSIHEKKKIYPNQTTNLKIFQGILVRTFDCHTNFSLEIRISPSQIFYGILSQV